MIQKKGVEKCFFTQDIYFLNNKQFKNYLKVINFRETKKNGFREHLFSRIERFQKFREQIFANREMIKKIYIVYYCNTCVHGKGK